ncbi:hypothetical protein L1987_32299 [Smallanthus sonchifolius]|uniref:Uncharacterized protein n=1 Tax=Smallanthus sonchifolius TaxID=185202 RepID=A0ACB9I798_9ASTR|nr:hypothetical protein L1987_32299 [Smallanthus sonchifolius]
MLHLGSTPIHGWDPPPVPLFPLKSVNIHTLPCILTQQFLHNLQVKTLAQLSISAGIIWEHNNFKKSGLVLTGLC